MERVTFAGGLAEADRPEVERTFRQLLNRLEDRSAELELSVKDRDQPGMKTTLEAKIHGLTRLVATSSEAGFTDALQDVSSDVLRQVNDRVRSPRG
ncbi:hypothetical protein [Ornithinimicrobium panacihumi]|uniref:hypothetical protein n=1 Tax=Ornithinimicrobium panacihumi TaxID=2008449 RepID=UPI003F8876AD